MVFDGVCNSLKIIKLVILLGNCVCYIVLNDRQRLFLRLKECCYLFLGRFIIMCIRCRLASDVHPISKN